MNERKCKPLVAERSDGLCERCGRQAHTFHHRLKRGQGGKWTLDNIVHVCGHGTMGCHGWIETHPNDAHEEGFHVRPWEDPAARKLLIHNTFWATLACDSPKYNRCSNNEYQESA